MKHLKASTAQQPDSDMTNSFRRLGRQSSSMWFSCTWEIVVTLLGSCITFPPQPGSNWWCHPYLLLMVHTYIKFKSMQIHVDRYHLRGEVNSVPCSHVDHGDDFKQRWLTTQLGDEHCSQQLCLVPVQGNLQPVTVGRATCQGPLPYPLHMIMMVHMIIIMGSGMLVAWRRVEKPCCRAKRHVLSQNQFVIFL